MSGSNPGREKTAYLLIVMAAVAFAAVSFSIGILYLVGFEQQKNRLIETAHIQARLIESVARFDAEYSTLDHPGGAFGATLSQIADAHESHDWLTETSEFTLARLEGDKMVFLLAHRQGDRTTPSKPVPFNTDIAEPMRRALKGEAGSGVALDYRGVKVLAAFEPVRWPDEKIGIVIKIDMAEIRAPFKKAGLITAIFTTAAVLFGAFVFGVFGKSPVQRKTGIYFSKKADAVKGTIKTNVPLIALSIALAAAIFIMDITIPLGVAGGVPYVVIVLVSMWLPRREYTIIMAIIGTVLTMAGFFLSPAGGEMWKVVFNRFIALFVIWVTAVLILYYKRAEEEILESANSLARAQKIANIGDWNYDIASKNVIWSDQLYRIYGFKPKEVMPTLHTFQNLIHPDDSNRVNNAIEMALNKEKPYDIEFRIVRSDGTERVIHSQGEVEFDQEGGPIRMYGIASDITERKRAEEALHTSEKRLKRAEEMAVLGNWEWNIVTDKLTWSEQTYRIFGYELGEITPSYDVFHNLVHPDDREFMFAAIEKTLKENVPYGVEYRVIRKDGTERIIHAHGELSLDDNNKPINIFGTNLDITERKRAEEALRLALGKLAKANEEIKSFASIVSHDLRSPLVNMKGFSGELKSSFETLKDILDEASPRLTEEQNRLAGEVLKEEIPEAFGFIDSSANAMGKLVSSIMALARIGERKLNCFEVDIGRLVDEKLKSMHHQIEEKNVEVKINGLPSVVADEMCMERIFGNILSNSIMYMDADRPGLISISGEKRVADTLFKVEDNGIGIPHYARNKVFEIFRRGAGKDIPGEGMGLAYVKALVERHDGVVWFETREGKGTTFYFTISNNLKPVEKTDGQE